MFDPKTVFAPAVTRADVAGKLNDFCAYWGYEVPPFQEDDARLTDALCKEIAGLSADVFVYDEDADGDTIAEILEGHGLLER